VRGAAAFTLDSSGADVVAKGGQHHMDKKVCFSKSASKGKSLAMGRTVRVERTEWHEVVIRKLQESKRALEESNKEDRMLLGRAPV
jgi:hypothetical protein